MRNEKGQFTTGERPKEMREKMSRTHMGVKMSLETRRRMSDSLKGRKIHWADKIRKNHKGGITKGYHYSGDKLNIMRSKFLGKNNPRWKGGVTGVNAKIRKSLEYKLWREAVFKRDNWKCVWCERKGDINADHIKPFSLFPELRFAIDNGRTLCVSCHKTTKSYLNNKIKKNDYGQI